jgi:hypothetical protein
VHSPAGGQSMNTGIQDAITLGHVLAKVLSGQVAESWLDTYEHRRRPVGLHVVALTDRITRVATLDTVGPGPAECHPTCCRPDPRRSATACRRTVRIALQVRIFECRFSLIICI